MFASVLIDDQLHENWIASIWKLDTSSLGITCQ